MALIDDTYFWGDISLPVDKYSDIYSYISRYEAEILRELLGLTMAAEVLAYNSTTSSQPIKDLVEGMKSYTDEMGRAQLWIGLINKDFGSLIAYYVYTRYRRDHVTTTTTAGEVIPAVENSITVDGSMKYWRAWAKFLEQAESMYGFIKANIDDYPDFKETDLDFFRGLNAFDL